MATAKGVERSGRWRTGFERKRHLRELKEDWQEGDQFQGVDKEIIHVDDEPSFGNHVTERVIHKSLKSGGGIGESEEHNGGFK